MVFAVGALILLGVALWRLLVLESRIREQQEIIEELHQRVWQLEDLVAALHRNRESRP